MALSRCILNDLRCSGTEETGGQRGAGHWAISEARDGLKSAHEPGWDLRARSVYEISDLHERRHHGKTKLWVGPTDV